MIRNILARYILGTALCCCSILIGPKSAQAFVWPTIDLAEVTSFVNSINTGLQQIISIKSQVDNAINTVKVVGDQVSSVMKYATDLKNTVANVQDKVSSTISSVEDGMNGIGYAMADVGNKLEGENSKNQKISSATASKVEARVRAGAPESEIQTTLSDYKNEIISPMLATNEIFDDVKINIDSTTENSQKAIEMLISGINQNSDLRDYEKQALQDQATSIKKDISGIQSKASYIISSTKDNYNQKYSQQVAEAFDKYSQLISAYYAGKIDQNSLQDAGKDFEKNISEANTNIDDSMVSDLVLDIQKFADNIHNLENNIINNISNSKGYSDGSEEANNKILEEKTYVFSFISDKETALFSAIYHKGNFEISNELKCPKFSGMDEIESDISGLRMCLDKAKGDKDTWGDIYKEDLYKDYKRDGVYHHIVKDYNIANIIGVSRAKQFAATWGNLEPDEEKGTLQKLQDMLKNVSNTREAFAAMGMIDIEAPKIWSLIRRMDALYRSKVAMQAYETEPILYINENTDEDFAQAKRKLQGIIINESDLDPREPKIVKGKRLFTDVFLYLCFPDELFAKDISVSVVNKRENVKYKEAEKKLKKCLYKYALNANKQEGQNAEMLKEEWRRKQKKAYNESVLYNFAIAATNIYKSNRDNDEKNINSKEKSIISLQEGLINSTTTKDDYSAGAQINYYATQQILSIVSSDAQNQQTEILKDLSTFNYNYFDDIDAAEGE